MNDNPAKFPAPEDMSYEAAELDTLRHSLCMTFEQRIEWLEEATWMVSEIQKSVRPSMVKEPESEYK